MEMAPSSILGLQDTAPEAERVLIELYRKMTPQEKVERVLAMGRAIDSLVEGEIRSRRPGISQRELQLRVASRRIPPELMKEAFGWDPAVQGY